MEYRLIYTCTYSSVGAIEYSHKGSEESLEFSITPGESENSDELAEKYAEAIIERMNNEGRERKLSYEKVRLQRIDQREKLTLIS